LLVHAFSGVTTQKLQAHAACAVFDPDDLLSHVGLPIKMLLRLLFHIKYVWITPWFNV